MRLTPQDADHQNRLPLTEKSTRPAPKHMRERIARVAAERRRRPKSDLQKTHVARMKLTGENADNMDSRPPTGDVDMEMVPEHMREGVGKRRAERAAAAAECEKRATLSPGNPE
jgi:hypothetical protein